MNTTEWFLKYEGKKIIKSGWTNSYVIPRKLLSKNVVTFIQVFIGGPKRGTKKYRNILYPESKDWEVYSDTQDQPIQQTLHIDRIETPIDKGTMSCNHRWTSYTGLSETFEYCIKCDKRR